jgi:hypothetical protein
MRGRMTTDRRGIVILALIALVGSAIIVGLQPYSMSSPLQGTG